MINIFSNQSLTCLTCLHSSETNTCSQFAVHTAYIYIYCLIYLEEVKNLNRISVIWTTTSAVMMKARLWQFYLQLLSTFWRLDDIVSSNCIMKFLFFVVNSCHCNTETHECTRARLQFKLSEYSQYSIHPWTSSSSKHIIIIITHEHHHHHHHPSASSSSSSPMSIIIIITHEHHHHHHPRATNRSCRFADEHRMMSVLFRYHYLDSCRGRLRGEHSSGVAFYKCQLTITKFQPGSGYNIT